MAEDAVAVPVQVDNAVWKILVVDDEPAIHQVTKLALRNLTVQGRPSQLINALSARDAREQLARHPDIAVVLLDVVMETEDAGLEFIKHIREQAANPLVRIILRTGQPGQAPERQVMVDYDINDYKEKTELTASKLFTTVMSSIRTFGHLQAMQGWQHAVEVFGHLNTELFAAASQADLAKTLVAQLVRLDLFKAVACWTEPDASAPLAAHGAPAVPDVHRTVLHWALAAPGTLMAQDNLYAVVLAAAPTATLALSMVSALPLSAEASHRLELWRQSVMVVLEHRSAMACVELQP
jgi:CheY-like chemotaxis protein